MLRTAVEWKLAEVGAVETELTEDPKKSGKPSGRAAATYARADIYGNQISSANDDNGYFSLDKAHRAGEDSDSD